MNTPTIEYKVRRSNSPGEWRVRRYVNGVLDPAADYFTDSRKDAEDTRDAMQAFADEEAQSMTQATIHSRELVTR